MSIVTNILLSVGTLDWDDLEDGRPPLDAVNAYFYPRRGLLPLGEVGGWKAFEAAVFTGAFNHLDLPAFMAHLRALTWHEPELVQVVVKEQEDDLFRILRLSDPAD